MLIIKGSHSIVLLPLLLLIIVCVLVRTAAEGGQMGQQQARGEERSETSPTSVVAQPAITHVKSPGGVHQEVETIIRRPSGAGLGPRKSWPQMVGMLGEEAVATIKAEAPELKIVRAIRVGSMVTMDVRMDRVRVWVNEEGRVVKPPTTG